MNLLRSLESRLPDRLVEPLTRAALFAATVSGIRRLPVSLLTGKTPDSDVEATMLSVGHQPWIDYLPSCFFDGTPKRQALGDFSIGQLRNVLDAHRESADLTVVRLDHWSARRRPLPGFIAVPEWIGTRLRVPNDLEALLRSGSSIKSDISLVRRNGFEPSFDSDNEAFTFFFERVYQPYAKGRFGDDRYTRTAHDLRRRLARGGLVWALDGEHRAAGGLYERSGSELSLLAIGTTDGEFAAVKRGAMAAVYYFVMQLALRTGCTTIDLRGCRPSLTDGVLKYKAKWGAFICEKAETYYDLLVRWNRPSPTVQDFFARHPLLFRDENGFSALTGGRSDDASAPTIAGLKSTYTLTENGPVTLSDA